MMNGKKELVDKFIKYLETRIFLLPFENPNLNPSLKDGNGNILARGAQPIYGVLRYGLFGTWEYIFPQESKDAVLTLLNFQNEVKAENNPSKLKMKARLKAIQLALALDKTPEFKIDHSILMPDGLIDHIRFIPLGVRYDTVGEIKGVIHEKL